MSASPGDGRSSKAHLRKRGPFCIYQLRPKLYGDLRAIPGTCPTSCGLFYARGATNRCCRKSSSVISELIFPQWLTQDILRASP
jgi:hypothetical protein